MNENQIAMFLQILGLLVGTGFGTIFLNPEIVGKFAHKINNIFLKQGDDLMSTLSLVKKFLPEISSVPRVKYTHFASLFMATLWVLFSLSLIFDIRWLFWVVISFFSSYIIVGIFDFILRLRTKQYTFWAEVSRLGIRWTLGLVISPIFHTFLVITYYIISLIVLVFDSIARKNKFRRGLIIVGFIMIIIGMIWEYFLIE